MLSLTKHHPVTYFSISSSQRSKEGFVIIRSLGVRDRVRGLELGIHYLKFRVAFLGVPYLSLTYQQTSSCQGIPSGYQYCKQL